MGVSELLTVEEREDLLKLANPDGTQGQTKSTLHADGEKKKAEPLTVKMATIQSEKVDWLWPNRIPLERLTLWDGDPGAGKSILSLAIATAVSRGDPLPGGDVSAPGNILLMSIEDGFADTVRPRLDAMGADVERISIPNPKRGLAPSLMNAAAIEQMVKVVDPKLLILDPIIAFSGRKDADKAGQVRELLAPLMDMARRYSFACIMIRHFTKQENYKAMYRGAGSIDWMAAVRSAFIIAEDEEGLRTLAHVKNSLGPKSPSLSFFIYGENGVARFKWGEEVATSAEELLASNQTGTKKRERNQLDAAKAWLEKELANGPMPSNAVRDKAETDGIAWRTVWRAKEELVVKASKERGSGEWFWRLA